MKQKSIIFNKPYEVDFQSQPIPAIQKDTVLVKTKWSAISQGSEMLVYKGRVPSGWPMDSTLASLSGTFQYPLKYGYCTVGDVVAVDSNVMDEWLGKRVFVFHPHESHFLAKTEELIPIPSEISATEALFFPNMETAVNLLMDGAPIIGECAMVLGQGVVGLLTTALLSKFPLSLLITLDRYPLRRQVSLELGAHRSLDPVEEHIESRISEMIKSYTHQISPDLVYELSGEPSALEFAIASAGFDSRIVIGSWYGTQKTELSLGKDFHRNRVRLSSSQVSTIAPGFSGRWTKLRRREAVWKMIGRVKPERLISHRFSVNQVKQAYELLDKESQTAIQVVLSYDD